ncbi:MAG: hypothetical protein AB2L20_18900 [Mangrovibacterium sp.]
MKHWTEFLPEAVAIRRLGNDQMMLSERIDYACIQLKELKRQYAENESRILGLALNDWSAEEIEEAKRKARIQPKSKRRLSFLLFLLPCQAIGICEPFFPLISCSPFLFCQCFIGHCCTLPNRKMQIYSRNTEKKAILTNNAIISSA